MRELVVRSPASVWLATELHSADGSLAGHQQDRVSQFLLVDEATAPRVADERVHPLKEIVVSESEVHAVAVPRVAGNESRDGAGRRRLLRDRGGPRQVRPFSALVEQGPPHCHERLDTGWLQRANDSHGCGSAEQVFQSRILHDPRSRAHPRFLNNSPSAGRGR